VKGSFIVEYFSYLTRIFLEGGFVDNLLFGFGECDIMGSSLYVLSSQGFLVKNCLLFLVYCLKSLS